MTNNREKLVTRWENADTSGKQLIFNVIECAVAFGDPFYNEMQELLDKGDKDGMRAAIEKWTALIREGATA